MVWGRLSRLERSRQTTAQVGYTIITGRLTLGGDEASAQSFLGVFCSPGRAIISPRVITGTESRTVVRQFLSSILLIACVSAPVRPGASPVTPQPGVNAALRQRQQIERLITEFDPFSLDEEIPPATLTLAVRRCSRLAMVDSVAHNPFLQFASGEALRRLGRSQEAGQRYLLALRKADSDLETHILLGVLYDERNLQKLAQMEFDRALEIGRERGATNLDYVSSFFLRSGWQAYRAGNRPRAERHFQTAAAFDPTSYAPHLALARLHLAQRSPQALIDVLSAVRAMLQDFDSQFQIAMNLYLHGTFILAAIAAVVLLMIAVRYLPLIHHLLAERHPKMMPPWLRSASSWVILLLPLTWGIHPLWFGLLATAISWTCLQRKEKTILLLVVVALFAAPLLASLSCRLATALHPMEETALISRAQQSPWDRRLAAELERRTESDPDATEALASLALLMKRVGRFDKARTVLQQAIRVDERNPMLHNNLGNVYYALGDYDRAVDEYEKAKKLNPSSAAIHFNLGHVYLQDLRLAESSAALKTASELDLELVNRYVGTKSSSINCLVIDEQIGPLRLWRIATRGWLFYPASFSYANPLGAAPFRATGLSILALFLVVLVRSRAKSMVLHPRCSACGRPICSRCRHIEGVNAYCRECSSKGLHTSSSTVRVRVLEGIWKRRMRRTKILATVFTILYPGAGHIYIGNFWRGIAFLFIWTSLLALWWHRSLLVPMQTTVTPPRSTLLIASSILFTLVIYSSAVRSILLRVPIYARQQAMHRQGTESTNGIAG